MKVLTSINIFLVGDRDVYSIFFLGGGGGNF